MDATESEMRHIINERKLQLNNEKEANFPADMVIEGSDQHGRWYMTSWLLSHAMAGGDKVTKRGDVPFLNMKTHGMILDQDGVKLSKSKMKSFVHPRDVLDGTMKADGQ